MVDLSNNYEQDFNLCQVLILDILCNYAELEIRSFRVFIYKA